MSQMPPPPSQPAPMGGSAPASGVGSNKKTYTILAYLFWWVTGLIFLFVGKDDPDVKWNAANSLVFFGGELFEGTLDASAQVVAFFPQLRELGTRGRQLVAQALNLPLELSDVAREGIRTAAAGHLRVRQVELQPLDGDLQLAALGEKLLNERVRRPGRLFRHSGKALAETPEAGGAPSRPEGNAP